MLANTKLVHFTPGRFRLKNPEFKKNPDLEINVKSYLNYIPVIQSVEFNSVTGSVLVLYDHTKRKEIASLLQKARLIGLLPKQFDIEYIAGFLCGDESYKKNGLDEDWLDVVSSYLIKNIADTQNSINYIEEMASPALFYVGLRSLALATMSPISSLLDYFWMSYSTLSAFNRMERPGLSLSNFKAFYNTLPKETVTKN